MAGGLGDSALMQNLQSALGVITLIAFAWAISENRRAVSPRRVATGLAISLVLAVLFLKVPPITAAVGSANHVIDAIAAASRTGSAKRGSSKPCRAPGKTSNRGGNGPGGASCMARRTRDAGVQSSSPPMRISSGAAATLSRNVSG